MNGFSKCPLQGDRWKYSKNVTSYITIIVWRKWLILQNVLKKWETRENNVYVSLFEIIEYAYSIQTMLSRSFFSDGWK